MGTISNNKILKKLISDFLKEKSIQTNKYVQRILSVTFLMDVRTDISGTKLSEIRWSQYDWGKKILKKNLFLKIFETTFWRRKNSDEEKSF